MFATLVQKAGDWYYGTETPPPSHSAAITKALGQKDGSSLSPTTQKIVDLFGGSQKFCQLPELAWKDKFHAGGTGYIDGVMPADMTHSIMRGVDPWHRPYIAFKVQEKDPEDNWAFTLFRRYSEYRSCWTEGSHRHGFDFVSCTVQKEALERLSALVSTGTSESTYGQVIHLA